MNVKDFSLGLKGVSIEMYGNGYSGDGLRGNGMSGNGVGSADFDSKDFDINWLKDI